MIVDHPRKPGSCLCARGSRRKSGRSGYLPGGRYPALLARFMASRPSANSSKGVVSSDRIAPPAACANERAAALTLSGISTMATISYRPKAYQECTIRPPSFFDDRANGLAAILGFVEQCLPGFGRVAGLNQVMRHRISWLLYPLRSTGQQVGRTPGWGPLVSALTTCSRPTPVVTSARSVFNVSSDTHHAHGCSADLP